jgi:hypothetical protein
MPSLFPQVRQASRLSRLIIQNGGEWLPWFGHMGFLLAEANARPAHQGREARASESTAADNRFFMQDKSLSKQKTQRPVYKCRAKKS